ncbi:hypothetical protein ABNM51_26470, partial [Pseudomonas syringae]
VRELPGTGSKTKRLGAPDTAKVACFRAALQSIADKSAPTPSGPKQPYAGPRYPSFVGADSSANCREPAAKRAPQHLCMTHSLKIALVMILYII